MAEHGDQQQPDTITIAIEGCCHGELDDIYGTLQHLERVEGKKIDLLISCGDFQAVRNMDDLETMACPPKYRDIQTFYKYYKGEKQAAFPTLFIGGNHEAANHLWELYYGGWAAPNIYFMGFTGCVKFGGLRIAGLSGIYKQGDYQRGHWEQLPYDESSMRSIYHVRDFEVYRLMQIQQPVDVFLSHDWPTNIALHGDTASLIKRKPFLAKEIEAGELGSPAGEQLLHALQPSYWFSAHLHTKFPAVVHHPGGGTTRFLALDKCLPGRDFLQVVTLPAKGPKRFEYDPEWLAIMRSTHGVLNLRRQPRPLPPGGQGQGKMARHGPQASDVAFVDKLLASKGGAALPVPENFVATVAAYEPPGLGGGRASRGRMPTAHIRNPQTVELLGMLDLSYNLDHKEAGGSGGGPWPAAGGRGRPVQAWPTSAAPPGVVLPPPPAALRNPEEIDLDDEDDGARQDQGAAVSKAAAAGAAPRNPEEIDLDGLDDEVQQGGLSLEVDPDAPPDDQEDEGRPERDEDPMFQPIGL